MTKSLCWYVLPTLAAAAGLGFLACEDSDPVAIEGSQIIMTASPNPVDIDADPTGTSQVQARLMTSTGVPQADTILFFSTTTGAVSPDSDVTDSEGRAFTTFTSSATTTATVTAQSGSIKGTVSIQVLQGTPGSHLLNAADSVFNTCSEVIVITGTVLNASGSPLPNVQVTFAILSETVSGLLDVNPDSVLTNSSGAYTVDGLIDNSKCNSTCVGAPTCEVRLRATAGGVQSNELRITDGV
jgi:hypothetical protein